MKFLITFRRNSMQSKICLKNLYRYVNSLANIWKKFSGVGRKLSSLLKVDAIVNGIIDFQPSLANSIMTPFCKASLVCRIRISNLQEIVHCNSMKCLKTQLTLIAPLKMALDSYHKFNQLLISRPCLSKRRLS